LTLHPGQVDHRRMLASLAQRIVKAASWRRLGLLVLVYAGIITTLGKLEDRIKQHSGGLGVPDLIFGFSADELHARLASFGDEGRRIYLFAELVDLVYPLVYTATFASILALAARRLFGETSRATLVCLLPVAMLVADYLENAGILVSLAVWPSRLAAAEGLASAFNHVKWAIAFPVFALMGLGLVAAAIHALLGKKA
jgi:hypothetical protein